jgi:hypothetical protein
MIGGVRSEPIPEVIQQSDYIPRNFLKEGFIPFFILFVNFTQISRSQAFSYFQNKNKTTSFLYNLYIHL